MTNDNKEVVLTEEKSDKATKSPKGIAAVSFLISLFDKLGEFLYNGIIEGFFGKIFTCYQKMQKNFTESACGKVLFGNHRIRKLC